MNELYPPPSAFFWQELYRVALFESDPHRLPDLIARAESAIALRARQLFALEGDHIEEEQAIDDALYALHALRSCVQLRSGFSAAA